MKKILLVLTALVLLGSTLLACSNEVATTTPTTTPPITATTTPPPTATTPPPTTAISGPAIAPPPGEPQYGGTLRQIESSSPTCLSYWPEMTPTDEGAVTPAVERLIDHDENHQEIPYLAESYEVDKDNKTLTFYLREGIKFSDGSDFNAEAVAWNLEMLVGFQKSLYASYVKEVEVVDDYTVTLHLTDINNQCLVQLGWVPIFSKEAWEKAGGGDIEKSKEWARTHVVGTGPFILEEYARDSHMTWVKNPNYWQAGKPYLDRIEVTYIPDPVTAATLMKAGEADIWTSPMIGDVAELEKMGLISQGDFGIDRVIHMNTLNPDSPFRDQKVREALEYALDRPALAKALGFGYYVPLTSMAPPGVWGYDPSLERAYNAETAKQLLADAGYTSPLHVKLLIMQSNVEEATAIKQCLDDAGFDCELDVADPGRFFGSLYGSGWDDMVLWLVGLGPSFFVSIGELGPMPFTKAVSYVTPDELADLFYDGYQIYEDEESQKEITEEIVQMVYDEALCIPLYRIPSLVIFQPYVHTTWGQETTVVRTWYHEWVDEH